MDVIDLVRQIGVNYPILTKDDENILFQKVANTAAVIRKEVSNNSQMLSEVAKHVSNTYRKPHKIVHYVHTNLTDSEKKNASIFNIEKFIKDSSPNNFLICEFKVRYLIDTITEKNIAINQAYLEYLETVNFIALSNVRLVYWVINKSKKILENNNKTIDEVWPECFENLLTAVEKYDSKISMWSTYARQWILQPIHRAAKEHSKKIKTINLTNYNLFAESNNILDEILAYTIDFDLVSEQIDLYNILMKLPNKKREVLFLRYGIGCKPKTLEEVGNVVGLTKERIRQIEKEVMIVIRESFDHEQNE